jgi:hypothetical protein
MKPRTALKHPEEVQAISEIPPQQIGSLWAALWASCVHIKGLSRHMPQRQNRNDVSSASTLLSHAQKTNNPHTSS